MTSSAPKLPSPSNPSPRAQFREAVVVRPQIAPGRSRIGGGKAWSLVVALLILLLGVPVVLLVTR